MFKEQRHDIEQFLIKEFKGRLCKYGDEPILFWKRNLEIHLNTKDKRKYPQSRINKVVNAFPAIFAKGVYVKTDESTADYIKYDYTDEVTKEIEAMYEQEQGNTEQEQGGN